MPKKVEEKPKDAERVAAQYKKQVKDLKEQMEKKPTNYLSRKFILTVALLVVGMVFVFMDKVDGMEFLVFAAAMAGIYGVANVAQKKIIEE